MVTPEPYLLDQMSSVLHGVHELISDPNEKKVINTSQEFKKVSFRAKVYPRSEVRRNDC